MFFQNSHSSNQPNGPRHKENAIVAWSSTTCLAIENLKAKHHQLIANNFRRLDGQKLPTSNWLCCFQFPSPRSSCFFCIYIYTHVLYRFLLPPSSCLAFLFCICCNQKWQGKSAFTHRQALFGNYHRSDFNSTPASDLLSTFQLLALVQAPGNNELARIHIKYKKKNISTLLLQFCMKTSTTKLEFIRNRQDHYMVWCRKGKGGRKGNVIESSFEF